MSQAVTLDATPRSDVGKGASRRLRRNEQVPVIVYGGDTAPEALVISHHVLKRATEEEKFYSSIIELNVEGKTQKVVIKDLQRHPYKPKIAHADFQRINENEKITVLIPLHFVGEDVAPGVKLGGGTIIHTKNEVEISCLPKNLPEFLEVDMSALEVGQSAHLSDLKLPEGVQLPNVEKGNSYDVAVANILASKGSSDEDDAAGDAPAADSAASEEGKSE